MKYLILMTTLLLANLSLVAADDGKPYWIQGTYIASDMHTAWRENTNVKRSQFQSVLSFQFGYTFYKQWGLSLELAAHTGDGDKSFPQIYEGINSQEIESAYLSKRKDGDDFSMSLSARVHYVFVLGKFRIIPSYGVSLMGFEAREKNFLVKPRGEDKEYELAFKKKTSSDNICMMHSALNIHYQLPKDFFINVELMHMESFNRYRLERTISDKETDEVIDRKTYKSKRPRKIGAGIGVGYCF